MLKNTQPIFCQDSEFQIHNGNLISILYVVSILLLYIEVPIES